MPRDGGLDRSNALVSSDLTPHARISSRSTTLDDPKTAPPQPGARRPRKSPPGLRAQFKATRTAVVALVNAHVELAKTEMAAIAAQVGRVAALAAVAIVLVILAALLAVIGTSLFLGEWLFGSIGWGVVHGILLFVGVALAAVLIALGVWFQRIVRALATSIVIGLAVGVLLGLDLPNRLYEAIGRSAGVAVDPGARPLVVGLIVGALVGLVAGLVVAARMHGARGGRSAAVAGLIVLGTLVGAVSAITFGPQVGAALGFTVGYVAWIALMGMDVARTGIDTDALKARFYPGETIETSKETLEWLQKRMPPGIGS